MELLYFSVDEDFIFDFFDGLFDVQELFLLNFQLIFFFFGFGGDIFVQSENKIVVDFSVYVRKYLIVLVLNLSIVLEIVIEEFQ